MGELEKKDTHQLRSYAILSIAQTAVQDLLACLSLKLKPDLKKPEEALSLILNSNQKQTKKITQSLNPSTKQVLYHQSETIHASIDISSLDLSGCVKILRKIGEFSTSDENNRSSLTCKDKNHMKNQTCCTNCDHKCSKCEKEKCIKDKCCLTETKCSHECQDCETDVNECSNNKRVCCKECGTCLYCFLKIKGLKNRDHLYKKLTEEEIVGICEEQELRLSLHMILAFRNMTMHSTEVQYNDMDNNSFFYEQLPAYCSSWELVRDTICYATETVLKYLGKNDPKFTKRQLMKQQQALLNIDRMTTGEVLSIYGNQINKFLTTEHLLQISKDTEELNAKMDKLSLKSLKILVKYIFKKPEEFHMHSKMADKIERHFKESWEDRPESNGFDIIMNGIHSENKTPRLTSSGLDSLVLKFEVEQSQSHQFPKDFKNGRSELSKELWNHMETIVQAKLPYVDSIKLIAWELGSIIVYMKLCRKSGEIFSSEEVFQIQSMLPAINQEIMKEFEGYICKSQIAARDDNDKDENTITFLLEAKNEWGARFLETLKRKPSIELQRFLNSSKLCRCTDSYLCCYEEFFFPIDIWIEGEKHLPLESITNLFITQKARRHTPSVELLVKLFNKIMKVLQRTSYAEEYELIKYEIVKEDVISPVTMPVLWQDSPKEKRRKKVYKTPNSTFNEPRRDKKSKKRKQNKAKVVTIHFWLNEEKLLLKGDVEFFGEVPDEEIQLIPEKYYPIINEGVKEFDKLLHIAVKGERKRNEINPGETTTLDAMKKQEIEVSDGCAEDMKNDLKIDHLPLKNYPFKDGREAITCGVIEKQRKGSQFDPKVEPLLRQSIWRLNWILDQEFCT